MRGMNFMASAIRTPGAGAVIHCADDEWDKAYGKPEERKSKSGKSFEKYKEDLGQFRATTAGGIHGVPGRGGTLAAPEIKFEVLLEIYPWLARDVKNDNALPEDKRKGREQQAKEYLGSLNKAFRLVKIDTVEAQANYLAHAKEESSQFRAFTETQAVMRGGAIKKKDDVHRMAEANKAFAHYRW